jgi:NADH-quinone oxidoreductase subunit K
MLDIIIIINILFIIGLLGLYLNRKHVIVILIVLEILFLSINLNLIVYSVFIDSILGSIYLLIVLTIAAAEAAIGLSIVILLYRVRGGISVDLVSLLKG